MSEQPPSIFPFDRDVIEGWRKFGIPFDHSTVEYAAELLPKLLDRCDAFEELWLNAVEAAHKGNRCEPCMGTGGVRVPCMKCKNGDSEHSHKCASCGGAGRLVDEAIGGKTDE